MTLLPLLLLSVAQPAPADTVATLKFIESLRDPATGVYTVTPGGKPNLRAVNGAVKATRLLGGTVTGEDKLRAFVLACLDPATGGFAEEPGGKITVPATAVGVITAVGLGVPKEKVRPAMDHLRDNAKTWDEVRIAGAAVEAWGVTDCPFDLTPWDAVAELVGRTSSVMPPGGDPTEFGGYVAYKRRLGRRVSSDGDGEVLMWAVSDCLNDGRRPDGGWGKKGATGSDLESTYRVMRALHLLKGKTPRVAEVKADAAAVRRLLASCHNPDGGYAVTPKGPSSMSGVYYATMIESWLK